MKISKFIFKLLFILFLFTNIIADEVDIKSSEIDIKENGNLIISYDSIHTLKNKNISIFSKKTEYYKSENKLIFSDNVLFNDLNNKIIIRGDKFIYNIKDDIIFSIGFADTNIDEKYKIKSKNLIYNRLKKELRSIEETEIIDHENNRYQLNEDFRLLLEKEIIKSKKTTIIDKNNNRYLFDDVMINLKNNNVAGKELKIDFEDSYFGNEKNDPELLGRSAISNSENMKIYNAVFSTCNTEQKKCRGWELNSKEFNHDKNKKIFEYSGSWLKIFGFKIIYLPYFNHPDPSVKRKSGFLTPSYSSSNSLGTAINIPYFKVLDIDKDITVSPRFYADKSFLLQNEYRQSLEKSKILSDFSFLVGSEGTKFHFFYNQFGKVNNNLDYEINLQDVKGDNYLKKHKLAFSSPLIKNESLLLSNLDFKWSKSNTKFDTSFKIYEDLSRNYHDRYQYIFPDFSFKKNIDIPSSYNGSFDFHSQGYYKNYETNINETLIINDFIFKSKNFVSTKGFLSNYNLLLKNVNNYSKNSTNFDDNANYSLMTTAKYDFSYPLQKKEEDLKNLLTPKFSIRYSPNGNSKLSENDVSLNYNNVYSFNRIGINSQVEGGTSVSLGFEFSRENTEKDNFLDFKVANVIKTKKNKDLPEKSNLDQTRSDIIGELNYKFNNNFGFGYLFSLDRDLKSSNLDGIDFDFKVNNFFTNFYYYSEENKINKIENIKNETNYFFNNENKIGFVTSKNLLDDYTQFYDLIYEYNTDCISLNFTYNRTFYDAGNLEPSKSLSFLVKIIPFTELGVSNISKVLDN